MARSNLGWFLQLNYISLALACAGTWCWAKSLDDRKIGAHKHSTMHPMFLLQRKSHRFGPGAPDLGVIFEQDPLRLTGFIRGTVPDTVPLISSGAPYPVQVRQMQPMRLFLFSGRHFQGTFDNAQWRKAKQMQPM